MPLDIRSLLTKYRIQWRDRGKNVSHNNLVINCPFCSKTSNPDLGEHLAINYLTNEYFCYRNPSHKGRNLVRLFKLLNIPSHEYSDLKISTDAPQVTKVEKDYSLMRFFQNGGENQEVISYLQSRNFLHPVEVCRRFRLMCDKEGKWAGRLIIPLTIGWTGRAMRSHIEPRYLAYTNEDGFFLYKQGSSTCIVVEGALDAMRIVSVSSQFDVVAKCGNRLSAALLNYLKDSHYLTIWNTPDGDVDFNQFFQETNLLRSYCTYSTVKRFQLPGEFKDFGQMEENQARYVLGTFQ